MKSIRPQTAMEKFYMKFDLPPKPDDEIPTIPSYLEELSDAKLMELYGQYMAWMSYAKAELVQAEIAEERVATTSRSLSLKYSSGSGALLQKATQSLWQKHAVTSTLR